MGYKKRFPFFGTSTSHPPASNARREAGEEPGPLATEATPAVRRQLSWGIGGFYPGGGGGGRGVCLAEIKESPRAFVLLRSAWRQLVSFLSPWARILWGFMGYCHRGFRQCRVQARKQGFILEMSQFEGILQLFRDVELQCGIFGFQFPQGGFKLQVP